MRKSRAAASRSPRPLIGFAAPQVGQHRIRAQRDGAAVGLDRRKRLVVAQGGVAAGEQGAVVAVARGRLIGHRRQRPPTMTRTASDAERSAAWLGYLTKLGGGGNFGRRPGSNGSGDCWPMSLTPCYSERCRN